MIKALLLSFLLLFTTACTAETKPTPAPKVDTKKQKTENPVVVLQTNQGDIELELFPKVAPKAVKNFIELSKKGYYDGIIFHRVIKGFMIQGGDPTGTGRGGESIYGGVFENEYAPNVIFDKPGILAMANAGPNTNGSQFFITTVPTPHLNGGYTIFGKVIKGFDVVQRIENCKTARGDRPVVKQVIKKATVK
jgi:peptidylprolyl isomerase